MCPRLSVLTAVAAVLVVASAGPPATRAAPRQGTTFTVTTTDDPGNLLCRQDDCSLRAALNDANTSPGRDTIAFSTPAGSLFYIGAPLPRITDPVVIQGNAAVLVGALAGATTSGLVIEAGGATIRGLVIGAFGLNGIEVHGPGGNRFEYNHIGALPKANLRGNGGVGIWIDDSADNVIGGDLTDGFCKSPCNVLSGNGLHGIEIKGQASTRNSVRGNVIGVDADGTKALANAASGVRLLAGAHDNAIGGPPSAAGICDQGCNLIGGNGLHGVELSDAETTGNVITGNFIGLASDGTTEVGNAQTGVLVNGAPGTRVGGTGERAGNVLSGNKTAGVWVQGGPAGVRVEGNLVGTSAKGDAPRGNGHGLRVVDTPGVVVGGTTPGARNVFSGNRFAGVYLVGKATTGVKVQGNLIGTDVTGQLADPDGQPNSGDELGNRVNGVVIDGAPGNLIGGVEPAARNVISGNVLHGVEIVNPEARANQVVGNFIGTGIDGNGGLPNGQDGVLVANAGANEIGGAAGHRAGACAGACNVISANLLHGVEVQGPQAVMNFVAGNYVGLRGDGQGRLGNGQHGVALTQGSQQADVGSNAANVIAGNAGCGVAVGGEATSYNLIRGNLIGLGPNGDYRDPDGVPGSLDDLGNGLHGVCIVDAAQNTVGGATSDARNVISGNGRDGLRIVGATASGNEVLGNYVGTDASGRQAAGNGANGVAVEAASDNRIGLRSTGGGNVISGNGAAGVLLTGAMKGSRGNEVQNNLIGLAADGATARPNRRGVEIDATGTGNRVGGHEPGAGNVISGNSGSGVVVTGSSDNWIQANVIGSDRDKTLLRGNGDWGILFTQGANDNVVGEIAAGTPPGGEVANTIAYNGLGGVAVVASTGNAIRKNAVFFNLGLGIDLLDTDEAAGVTPNDPLDPDEGANRFQNFPVLDFAGPTRLRAHLDSRPNARFHVEAFGNATCDSSTYGEGGWFLTAVDVATDSDGRAAIDTALPPSGPAWAFLTLTATDEGGNTSEFSACLGPGGAPPTPTATATGGAHRTRTVTPTATRGGGGGTPTPTRTRLPGSGQPVFLPLVLRNQAGIEPPPTAAAPPSPTPQPPVTPAPSRTASPTPDVLGTAVAATLTALAPSPTASGTASATPDLVGTAVAATLTARVPSPTVTATPEPGGVTLAALSTTGTDTSRMRVIFVAGDAISLWIQVDNRTGATASPQVDFTVVGRGGYAPPELAWSGTAAAPPGLSWTRLERSVPATAYVGAYSFIGTVSYGGTDTTLSSELFLARALVRSDDFSDPTSGWPDEVTAGHTVGYANGEYHMTITQADTWVAASPVRWADAGYATAEVDAHTQGSSAGAAGLALAMNRAVDDFYLFEVLRDGRWALFHRTGGAWQAVLPATPSPMVRPGDGLNHLAAVAVGQTLTLYCNGQIVGATDLALPAGRVGLYAEGATAGLDAGFDNIRVYATGGG
jgi:hypothetical protein